MAGSSSSSVIDVNEADFQAEVIERSRQTPVVVDFWAPWCGPCRMLSPILEGLAQENAGRFILAKINVDENPGVAARYGVQGIPMVKAFRDGEGVDEFVGAQPQPAVRQFIQRLLPSETDQQVARGRLLLGAGKTREAEDTFRAALVQQPEHLGAWLGLARALAEQRQDQAALDALAHVPLGTPEGNEAARLRQEIGLRVEVGNADETSLREQVASAPQDLEARYKLATLLAVERCYEEALDQYLEIVRRNRSFRNGAARDAMLHVFDTLGDDPLVRTYRNRLASVLFV
jgi:putative thioredoxin